MGGSVSCLSRMWNDADGLGEPLLSVSVGNPKGGGERVLVNYNPDLVLFRISHQTPVFTRTKHS